jgi:hypothetical protein
LEKALVIPILTNWAMFATQDYVEDYTLDFNGALIPGDVWLSE